MSWSSGNHLIEICSTCKHREVHESIFLTATKRTIFKSWPRSQGSKKGETFIPLLLHVNLLQTMPLPKMSVNKSFYRDFISFPCIFLTATQDNFLLHTSPKDIAILESNEIPISYLIVKEFDWYLRSKVHIIMWWIRRT